MSANREAAIGRIRALLAKTVANGCTEDEALAAASKAADLMERYAVTMTDVEIKAERCGVRRATERAHDVEYVARAIARLCGCKCWKEGGALRYFGLARDTDVAAYLTDLCRSAMEAGFKAYLRSPSRPRHAKGGRLRKSFMLGMAARLSDRLDAMAREREAQARTGSGTALVVVRNAVVEEQYAELGFRPRSARRSRATFHVAAGVAGALAGNKVALVSGVKMEDRAALPMGKQA